MREFIKLAREIGPWAAIILYLYAWMWSQALCEPATSGLRGK